MDIKIKGLDDVTGNLDSFSQNVQVELKEALDISLRDVQEYAREHHRFITRTGEAERSIETAANYGTYFKGVVGTTREVTVYLHTGTDRHVIVPRLKQSLRFVKDNKFTFARRVNHPGTKEDPFIYNALEHNRSDIISRFENAIASAVKEMG